VACPHRLPELTQRKQAIPNKGLLFFSHCVRDPVRHFKTDPTEIVAFCFGYRKHRVLEPIDNADEEGMSKQTITYNCLYQECHYHKCMYQQY
jgi:hypothetical protein